MATLEELRVQLDGIDNEIARLFEERMKVCGEVGEYKIQRRRFWTDKERIISLLMWHQKYTVSLIKRGFRSFIRS